MLVLEKALDDAYFLRKQDARRPKTGRAPGVDEQIRLFQP